MRQHLVRPSNRSGAAWLCVALLFVVPAAAEAAERVVLGEHFLTFG